MPQQRDPFLWKVQTTIITGVAPLLITEPWTGRDQVLHIEEISVCNTGHSGGDVEVGVVYGGHFFELDTVFNLVTAMYHYAHAKITILSKWKVYARFVREQEACVDGDVINLHVAGYVLEPFTTP